MHSKIMLPLYDCPSCISARQQTFQYFHWPSTSLLRTSLIRQISWPKENRSNKVAAHNNVRMCDEYLRYLQCRFRAYSGGLGHECVNACMRTSLHSVRVSLSTISQGLVDSGMDFAMLVLSPIHMGTKVMYLYTSIHKQHFENSFCGKKERK